MWKIKNNNKIEFYNPYCKIKEYFYQYYKKLYFLYTKIIFFTNISKKYFSLMELNQFSQKSINKQFKINQRKVW